MTATCPCGLPVLARGYCSTHYARWRKTGDAQLARPLGYPRKRGDRTDIAQRLAEKVALGPMFKDGTRCYVWTGAKNSKGYGNMRGPEQEILSAHRVAYELHNGPIPEGLEVDHLCRNRACVNPLHLEAVSHGENIRRGVRARRSA